jgi:hypothetical protein
MSATKRKKAVSQKAFLLSADRGAVVVRDRVVRVADCPSLDSISIYELCRRWMQDDAHARPDHSGANASDASADGRSASTTRNAPRVISPAALLSALETTRARQIERRTAALAKRVDLQPVLARSVAPDAPNTAAALREFVDRSRRERADWQVQFDKQTRLAEELLRSRTDTSDDND